MAKNKTMAKIKPNIAKIQLESEMVMLLNDIKAGADWNFYAPIRDKIIEKVKKNKLEIWAIKRFKELTCGKQKSVV
jgi:hypothetical protein